jgi:uncharacterized membrane protein
MQTLDMAARWIHLLSIITWLGGTLFLGMIAGPILRKNLSRKEMYGILLPVARRFSRIAWACLALILITGMWMARTTLFGGWALLGETTYGKSILLKLGGFIVILSLSYLHDFVWGPSLSARETSEEVRLRNRKRLSFWAHVNLLLGLGMVFLGVFLTRG